MTNYTKIGIELDVLDKDLTPICSASVSQTYSASSNISAIVDGYGGSLVSPVYFDSSSPYTLVFQNTGTTDAIVLAGSFTNVTSYHAGAGDIVIVHSQASVDLSQSSVASQPPLIKGLIVAE